MNPPEVQNDALAALRTALEQAQAGLLPPEAWQGPARETAQRLQERLQRDLLPRLSAEAPMLMAAIAGPNNVGKSSLFNALLGLQLSPARAEGGLTKQCLAAVAPALWTGPTRALLERRFDVVQVTPGDVPPVDLPGPSGRLYLALIPTAPEALLLLDTPDFDSVFRSNRTNAEALLVTVDVVLFVTSRQTYQNAALVDFLRVAVGHGRPYALIYNEAGNLETATGHLEKLASDVGQPPVARYLVPHSPEVEAGTAFLAPVPLGDAPSLQALLGAPAFAPKLKARALRASVADAEAELGELASAARALTKEPARLADRIRHELNQVGSRAALKGVPADVLVEAFRDELDARSRVHRYIRLPFRGLATAMTYVGRKLRASFQGPDAQPPAEENQTEATLKDGLAQTLEALAPEVASWTGDEATRTALRASLGPATRDALLLPLAWPELLQANADRAQLYQFCRTLVGRELQGGIEEGALQALTTLVYSVPASAAALVTVVTGGVGQDAVIWAGTLLSTPLFERFVDLLGSGVRANVQQRWAEDHGATLAGAVEAHFFAPVLARLDAQVAQSNAAAQSLTRAQLALQKASLS